ncbi:MAG: RDD family protein, partial [Methanosarcinales archaeon]
FGKIGIEKYEKADFGKRFIAYFLDGLILFIPTYVASSIIPYSGIIISAGYFTYFYGTTGQTPGKKVMHIKVVTTDGSDLDYGKGFLRWLGYIVSTITLFIGFLWIIWDENKQGFHDKIAGTYVVLES